MSDATRRRMEYICNMGSLVRGLVRTETGVILHERCVSFSGLGLIEKLEKLVVLE